MTQQKRLLAKSVAKSVHAHTTQGCSNAFLIIYNRYI